MFKLNYLKSPSKLFDTINFQAGLNIILGKYTKTNKGKDINGIGKSTIIDLIDLCLLADRPKKIFRDNKFEFLETHRVVLSITSNGKEILLEKRFSEINYIFVTENEKFERYSDSDYRMILGKMMINDSDYEGITNPKWFRTLMNFFIQDDHSFYNRKSSNIIKYVDGSSRKSELLTYLFFILGIDNTKIFEFDQNKIQLKQAQEDKTRMNKQIKENTGKEYKEVKAEIDIISTKIRDFEEQIDNFKFYEIGEEIESELEILNKDISLDYVALNKLKVKINRIKDSLNIDTDFESDRVYDLYNNISADFSKYIKKNFDEVLTFRKTIIDNRRRFLKEREIEYNREISQLVQKIKINEEKRSIIVKSQQNNKAFEEIKSSYKYLAEKKAELEKKKIYTNNIETTENDINTFKIESRVIIDELINEKEMYDKSINILKDIFYDLINNSIDIEPQDAKPYFQVEPRSHATSPILIDMEVPRSGSLGKDRFKILAFDLTVFIFLLGQKRSLPTFLIHDGVFHSIAHKTRIKYINYLNKTISSFEDSQYIITLNEDEVSLPDDYTGTIEDLDFDIESKAIIILEDTPDKMLFKKEF